MLGDDWDWRWTRDALEDEMSMATRLRRMQAVDPARRPQAFDALSGLRKITNGLGAFRRCGRSACVRSKTCLSPRVECGWRKLPWLQRDVFPELRRRARAASSDPAPAARTPNDQSDDGRPSCSQVPSSRVPSSRVPSSLVSSRKNPHMAINRGPP